MSFGSYYGSVHRSRERRLVVSEPDPGIGAEVRAFEGVLTALAPLDDETRRRVLAYVHLRFGDGIDATTEELTIPSPKPLVASDEGQLSVAITDIRTLKDKKQPKSAVEMAVLAAYYVSELAQPPERKSTIGTADINKYFKQANFRLPTQPNVTLHRAKNAGYLDTSARGEYSINPVGHNLVTHGLPRAAGGGRKTSSTRSRKKPTSKKPQRAKALATRKKTAGNSPKSVNRKKR
jgi:hypothetical protein